MPAIAIAGAVVGGMSIAAGVSGFALVGAIGAVAAGVGVVTKNAALTKLGAVAGAIGGIGALAQSSGMFAGAEAAIGATEAASGAAAASDLATGEAVGGLLRTGGEAEGGLLMRASDSGGFDPFGGQADKAVATAGKDYSAFTGAAPTDVAKPLADVTITPDATPQSVFARMREAADPVIKWGKDNPLLAFSAAQMLGSGLSFLDPIKGAQESALKSQIAANEQRLASIAAPQPRAGLLSQTRAPVYGATAPVFKQPGVTTGVINRA